MRWAISSPNSTVETGGTIYRIGVAYEGEDPRVALRLTDRFSRDEVETLRQRLVRFDGGSRRGPWTLQTLRLIDAHPATLAATLAAKAGNEKAWFKSNVRKLKELGLTESLKVGYRLSPRGEALLKEIG